MTRLEREVLILKGRLQYSNNTGNKDDMEEIGLLIHACEEQIKRENTESLCLTCYRNMTLSCRAEASDVYCEKVIGCVMYRNATLNLCDSCNKAYPACGSDDLEFGVGIGSDNIVICRTYESV